MDKVLVGVAAVTTAAYIGYSIYRPHTAQEGIASTASMLMQAAPWIIVSMLAAGLISQILDTHVIARYLGPQSGFMGIVTGALFGLVGTGSRWAVYPLAAGLLGADASPGAVFAFLTSWQLVSLPRVPAEFPFLGVRFTILRAVFSFAMAIFGGTLMNLGLNWFSR
ncbi:MAG: permease [Alicyclobacillaceae bacterium]|jgi:uncharacterized membrane protein YraQ (UPF0718 family)|uniref:permease n=1 Tax=Alicyclobacillus sp. SP_1 TaxID=2942475 RepID=UPI002158800C|nr:permease [Alicyclobacillus sp. SP_1]MCY0888975.1 permease [Alicyclobacillaceae bacterium]MCY0896686.1 permease [Alicyclobacillaceae bacterium]